MIGSKYSKEQIEKAAKASKSVFGALRELGLKLNGGNHSTIKWWIKKYGIDVSHFTGQATNCGEFHKGGPRRLTVEEILVVNRNRGRKECCARLRRTLIKTGVPYECVECRQKNIWQNRPLVLEIDHINGNPLDNRWENLRFLCPNCHSQTKNYGSKNKAT